MYTILRYANGRRIDGLILLATPELIRVALRRQGDTAELQMVFGEWRAEDGTSVELESVVIYHGSEWRCFRNFETRPKVRAAN